MLCAPLQVRSRYYHRNWHNNWKKSPKMGVLNFFPYKINFWDHWHMDLWPTPTFPLSIFLFWKICGLSPWPTHPIWTMSSFKLFIFIDGSPKLYLSRLLREAVKKNLKSLEIFQTLRTPPHPPIVWKFPNFRIFFKSAEKT